jgi:hypothetical protein
LDQRRRQAAFLFLLLGPIVLIQVENLMARVTRGEAATKVESVISLEVQSSQSPEIL